MKRVKKYLAAMLSIMMLLVNIEQINATGSNLKLALEVMELYGTILEKRDVSLVDDIIQSSEIFFDEYLDWRIAMMEILDVGYSKYDYEIQSVEYENDGTMRISFAETYVYENGAGSGCSSGSVMVVEPAEYGESKDVADIYLENNDFYDYFYGKVIATDATLYTERISTEAKVENLITDLHVLQSEMEKMYVEQAQLVLEERELEVSIQPYASSYSYSGSRGAAYASKYASSRNPYFYDAGSDCTNFVSQCIWAGYGGWNAAMSDSTMQSNISNKVRMTSSWFAGSGGGSSAWENVDYLWNHVVGNTGKGPKATGYNNGGSYTNILPIDISVGDVLQKSWDGSDYFHSMYVISTPGGSNPGLNEIVVAQHSSAYSTTTLSEAIAINGLYVRQMKFNAGSFDS